jgi:TRAP-type C4-dicarboxylate transport system substrate-binding protein
MHFNLDPNRGREAMKFSKQLGLSLAAAFALSASARAQEVVLKLHHFLPPGATIQKLVFEPWCEKIGKESGGRLKCQIYPAMQLGGTPPQLFDQARDGVADIVWSLPTYQAGRFTKSEVFEIPFMAKSAEAGSPALWEYIQKNALDEFKGTHLLAVHLHDGSLFHFTNKDVKTMEDLKGLKIRAPSRIGTKFLQALGATPVQHPNGAELVIWAIGGGFWGVLRLTAWHPRGCCSGVSVLPAGRLVR